MPFIDEQARENVETGNIETPGERCYVYYRQLVRTWKESPRWTTAHDLYKAMQDNLHYIGTDDRTAYQLAWQVFFNLYVMPYEMKKLEENGDVE